MRKSLELKQLRQTDFVRGFQFASTRLLSQCNLKSGYSMCFGRIEEGIGESGEDA